MGPVVPRLTQSSPKPSQCGTGPSRPDHPSPRQPLQPHPATLLLVHCPAATLATLLPPLPQGLCTGCSLCLAHTAPRAWLILSIQMSAQMSPPQRPSLTILPKAGSCPILLLPFTRFNCLWRPSTSHSIDSTCLWVYSQHGCADGPATGLRRPQ